MAESKPTLGYWNLRGIAQPIRYLLAYLEVPHTDVQYEILKNEEWLSVKETLGLKFPNLPYWIDGDVKLTEAKAILKYLARKYDPKLIPGEDPLAIAEFELVESLLFDVWNAIFQYVYFNTEVIIEYFPVSVGSKLKKLSEFVGDKQFCFGELSYVDFILGEIIVLVTRVDDKRVELPDNLKALGKRVESIPQVAKYRESPQFIEKPCFHPVYAKVKV